MSPNIDVDKIEPGIEREGILYPEDEGLSNSIIEGNKQRIEQGMLLDSSFNQGLFAFNPDMMFENLVKDFGSAEKIYGDGLLRLSTGYDKNAIKKNIKIPEFQREIKNKLKQKKKELQDEGLIDEEGVINDKGIKLSSLVMYTQELNNLEAKGLGEKKTKKIHLYGEKENIRNFRKHDRYRDIALKASVKNAIRKGKNNLDVEDLKTFERDTKGKINIIYALDASGSMKGKKIEVCKKAGVALAYKAINENDRVGLIVFGSDINEVVYPTTDFGMFLKSIANIRAKKQTDIAVTIQKAIEMFPKNDSTKHLVLITDAVPTVGNDPGKNTLNLVERANAFGITISVIGVELNNEGAELAKKIVEVGNGRLYIVRNLEQLDSIVLEDYYNL